MMEKSGRVQVTLEQLKLFNSKEMEKLAEIAKTPWGLTLDQLTEAFNSGNYEVVG